MRDGPPLDEETMSSETLLQEIATLRSRLRDLEEDGRSSICESFAADGDVATILKKEVVKLADEKAKQEKEFMNQMSSLAIENQSIIADLKSRLARTRAKAEELEDQVEALMDNHSTEIENLKENLTRADEEIADARHEIDYLQHENEELRSGKNEASAKIDALKLELENEKRRTESYRIQLKRSEDNIEHTQDEASAKDRVIADLREQIGEMNDSIAELEKEKEHTENQLKAVRAELAQVKLKWQNDRTKSIDHSIFSAEKERLERSCEQLEERLQRSQSKLAEKDATIESLTCALKEERKLRKELKTELGNGNNHNNDSDPFKDKSKEISFLRRRNKVLNEEVCELREKLNGTDESHGVSLSETSRNGSTLNHVTTPPRSSKKVGGLPVSPRTAVSGLVASFEKRIQGRGEEKREDTGSSCASDWSPSNDKSNEVRELQRTVEQLEFELQEERERVVELRKQFSSYKVENEAAASLERKLKKSLEQIDMLQRKVETLEKEKHQLCSDIEQLQCDSKIAKEIAALEQEKKDEERDEELNRLRSQVRALQSELSSALEQIDETNGEISRLEKIIETEKKIKEESEATIKDLMSQIEYAKTDSTIKESTQKRHNAEINKLKVDLTNAQLAKDDLQAELMARITELETEFEAMEMVANAEIDELKSQLSSMQATVASKNDQITLLEKEKSQLCNGMSMASNAKNDEFEELQSELIDKTAKNTAQAREIQALQMKIEELESIKRDKTEWLQIRVGELEQEVERLRSANKKSGSWEDIERLRHENIQLKETVRVIKMERRNLQERVEALVGERSSSKSVHVLRERNASLKDEVEKLTRRLKKMEESITRFAI